jgi:hypothetical protein
VVEVIKYDVGVRVVDVKVSAEVTKLLLSDEPISAGVAPLEQLFKV